MVNFARPEYYCRKACREDKTPPSGDSKIGAVTLITITVKKTPVGQYNIHTFTTMKT